MPWLSVTRLPLWVGRVPSKTLTGRHLWPRGRRDASLVDHRASFLRRHYPEQVQRSAPARRPLSPVRPSSRCVQSRTPWSVRNASTPATTLTRVRTQSDAGFHTMQASRNRRVLGGMASKLRTFPRLEASPETLEWSNQPSLVDRL